MAPGYEQKQFRQSNEAAGACVWSVRTTAARVQSRFIRMSICIASLLIEGQRAVTHCCATAGPGFRWHGATSSFNGDALHAGDAAAVSDAGQMTIEARSDAEFLLFDMA